MLKNNKDQANFEREGGLNVRNSCSDGRKNDMMNIKI